MIVDRVGSGAISPACRQEQDKETCHQRAEERPGLLVPRVAFCTRPIRQQRRTGTERHESPQRANAQQGKASIAQAFLLLGRQRLVLVAGLNGRARLWHPFPQTGLDDAVGYEPDDGQIDEQQGDDKVRIAGNVHRPADINAAGTIGGFGDAEQ